MSVSYSLLAFQPLYASLILYSLFNLFCVLTLNSLSDYVLVSYSLFANRAFYVSLILYFHSNFYMCFLFSIRLWIFMWHSFPVIAFRLLCMCLTFRFSTFKCVSYSLFSYRPFHVSFILYFHKLLCMFLIPYFILNLYMDLLSCIRLETFLCASYFPLFNLYVYLLFCIRFTIFMNVSSSLFALTFFVSLFCIRGSKYVFVFYSLFAFLPLHVSHIICFLLNFCVCFLFSIRFLNIYVQLLS